MKRRVPVAEEDGEVRRVASRGMAALMRWTDGGCLVLSSATFWRCVGESESLAAVTFCRCVGEPHDIVVVGGQDFAALAAGAGEWLGPWLGRSAKIGLFEETLDAATLRWGEVLHALVARHKYLLETLAQISTLGGGWASVGQRQRAKHYATQQRSIARLLQDETLELLSEVYIAYAVLFEGDKTRAAALIDRQAAIARKRNDRRQNAIIAAAYLQLERFGGHS